MSSIRVTYSGLISFAVGIVTVVTGLVFTLIVTRQLSQDEFGTWGLIGGLISYALIIGPIVSYWSTREIARGENSGKTALYSTGCFSSLAVLIYIGIAMLMGFQGIDQNLLILAAILVPVEFFRNILGSISLGFKPQIGEYGLLTFEIAKIPLAILMISYWDMGLSGVILTVALAYLANIIVLIIKTKEKLVGKFNVSFLKKWLKLFWLPTFPKISMIFNNSDVVVYTLMTGSVGGVAYWAVSRSVSRIVRHSLRVNKALYPKLLSGGKKQYFQENIVRVFYFAFPLTAISITFARPALFALNPIYEIVTPVIIIMSFLIFLRTLGDIFRQALTGLEKVDTSQKSNFIDYLKSKLFYLPLLTNIQRGVYILSLVIMLFLLIPSSQSEIELVIFWALLALFTQIPFTIYLYSLVRKEFQPKIDHFSIIKYFIATSVAFGLTYVVMEEFLVYNISIFQFLPEFLKFVFLACSVYLLITYIIDKKTRKLVSAILKEYKK